MAVFLLVTYFVKCIYINFYWRTLPHGVAKLVRVYIHIFDGSSNRKFTSTRQVFEVCDALWNSASVKSYW